MAELRGGAGLPQEALAQLGVAGAGGREQLDRHQAIEPHLSGEVDDPHAATPQLPLEGIAAGQRGLEIEKELVGMVGHGRMVLRDGRGR